MSTRAESLPGLSPCPAAEELKPLLGAAAAEQPGPVQRHAAVCPACQATLAELRAEAEAAQWRDVLCGSRTASGEPAAPDDVEAFLQRLKQRAPADDDTPVGRHDQSTCPISFPGPPTPDAPLGRLEHYCVLAERGRGAIGVVYRAWDERLRRVVALKVLKPELAADDHHRRRFEREGRAAAAVRHDHVLTVHQVGSSPSMPLPYLVLEYLDGESLSERLKRTGPLPAEEAARIVREAALGLAAAHQAGLLHRDVKSSNIMLETETGRAKVMDFGLARQLDGDSAELTGPGHIVGTPAYMSPEQITTPEHVDGRSDVYSLGVVLFELLTGERPFHGSELNVLRQTVQEEAPAPRKLQATTARDLDTICLKCLEKEPARRYGSALQLAEDLERFLAGKPIQARPVHLLRRLLKWARRRPAVAALLALVLVVSTLGVSLVAWKWQEAEVAWQRERERGAEARQHQNRAQEVAVRAALGRALALCEQGDIPKGILWLARSLELTQELAPEQAAGWEETIRWNLGAWQNELCVLQAIFPHSRTSPLAALSPDGRTLLTSSSNQYAYLWDVRTRQILATLKHGDRVWGVAFSPDSHRFATASGDKKASLFRFSPGIGPQLQAVLEHPQAVRAVSFRPDGRQLATACADGKTRLWEMVSEPNEGSDSSSPPRLRQQLAHPSVVSCLAYSPDGKQLVTGCEDGTAWRWSSDSGAALGSPLRHPGGRQVILAAAFSPDNRLLATGSVSGRTYLWDARTGDLHDTFQSDPGATRGLAFSPDTLTLATAGEGRAARFWDLPTGRLRGIPLRHRNHVHLVHFSPDGRTILTASIDQTVRLWDAPPTAPPAIELPTDNPEKAAAFAPNGRMSLSATISGRVYLFDNEGKPLGTPLEPRAAKPARFPSAHAGEVWTVAFDPTGQAFAAGTYEGTIQVWSTAAQQPLSEPLTHELILWDLAFSPAGNLLASGSQVGTAIVWDLATSRPRFVLKHPDQVTAVAFHPQLPELVTGSHDGKVRFWNLSDGTQSGQVFDHGSRVSSLALSRDGRYLITGGFRAAARLWNVASGQPIGPIMQHDRDIIALAFSSDSRLVATGSRDKTVRLWSVRSAQPIGPPLLHDREVYAVHFLDDGETLLTSTGGTLRRRPIPQPMQGPVAQIVLWAEVSTGMELDRTDTITGLEPESWQRKKATLLALPTLPESQRVLASSRQ